MVRHRIEELPNYYYGQLLTQEDFLAEQEFHVRARELHNRHFHGTGIVHGLDVDPSGDTAVSISTGLALDDRGREIRLHDAAILDLSKFSERDVLTISLSYEEEETDEETNRRTAYAVLAAVPQGEQIPGLTLAIVQLDDRAKVRADRINRSTRKFAGLPAGSVTVPALEPRLQSGWMRMPFRPFPLDKDPEDKDVLPPPFRVGATMAKSHSAINGVKNTLGAGETMSIPIPPGVRRIVKFRIAGEDNVDGIELLLVVGGWDAKNKDHVRRTLVDARREANAHLVGSQPTTPNAKSPYEKTWDIPDGDIDPEYSTLSLWLRGFGKTAVSLVAVQYSL